MYIRVQLLTGYKELLWYSCPSEWEKSRLVGSLVRVPLRQQQLPALILSKQTHKPDVPFDLRAATALEPVPDDPHYYRFIALLSTYHQISPVTLIKRIKSFLFQKEATIEGQPKPKPALEQQKIHLTSAQENIVRVLLPVVTNPEFSPAVLHGVTGSGKTEVYKELIKQAYAEGKTSLFWLPEVTLSLAFEKRLQKELPYIPSQ